jgi:SWI/SNF-related matrix-associated actin-dependent regulator 1 of chromatin subfamily A
MERLILKTLAEKGVDGLREIAPHVATLRRLTGIAKVAPVVEWVKDWLDAGGGKIVLFAHHREVIEGLQAGFPWHVSISGQTPAGSRQHIVDTFNEDPYATVFIGQIQAAGVGINLTAASDVLFVESSWVPAENSQAAMRVHRIGQKNACLIRFATLAGSIDEHIQKAVQRKTRDIAALFDA